MTFVGPATRLRRILLLTCAAGMVSSGAWAQIGAVKSHQKISETAGGFGGTLANFDRFGSPAAALGDLDGDGVTELAVGATGPGPGAPAVWVLFLDTDGTVKAEQKIGAGEGGFTGTIVPSDLFATSLAALGDLDGDGVEDMAVGAPLDDAGGGVNSNRGAVWILFLDTDGTVKSHQKISAVDGGFSGSLDEHDSFGHALASLGDLDGDGVGDLAVGASGDSDGSAHAGAVWILFLDTDGTVKSHQKISATQGGFTGALDDADNFGYSLAFLGDVDGDGVGDIAVGVPFDDDGGMDRGAMWILLLDTDGTVLGQQKISDVEGGFDGILRDATFFGGLIAAIGDLDGDGVGDLAVTGHKEGTPQGFWILFMNADRTVKSEQRIGAIAGGFTGALDPYDFFGGVAALQDLNGDGAPDLAVGAGGDDDGTTPGAMDRGAVWILFLCGDDTSPGCDRSGLEHMTMYKVRTTRGTPQPPPFGSVTLADQFRTADYDVRKPRLLGLPSDKNDEGAFDDVTHLREYRVKAARGTPRFERVKDVHVVNQCNDVLLEVRKPDSLLVPTNENPIAPAKAVDESEHRVDHFLCYRAAVQKSHSDGTPLPAFPHGMQVVVEDQFQTRRYDLRKITKLCTPVDVSGSPVLLGGPDRGQPFPITPATIRNPDGYLVCYKAARSRKLIAQNGCGPGDPLDRGTPIQPPQARHTKLTGIFLNNQLGEEQVDSVAEKEFCIPSEQVPAAP
jgi:hypothetical protein